MKTLHSRALGSSQFEHVKHMDRKKKTVNLFDAVKQKPPLICSSGSHKRLSVVIGASHQVFDCSLTPTVILEACLVCGGHHWQLQPSLSCPFPVQLHVFS